jgi:hypothetical protein
VYDTFTIPSATPVSIPLVAPMVAIEAFAVFHVPPFDGFVNVIVDPSHTTEGPAIASGSAFTVTVVARKQPVGNV